jgi:phage-related minor tail protein
VGRGLLSFLPGFAEGGYTGAGGKFQPAGVVHAGEFVFDKATTSMIGPGNLERLRRNIRGYAGGGMVGAAPNVNVEPSVEVVFVRSEQEAFEYLNSPKGRQQFRTMANEEGFRRG